MQKRAERGSSRTRPDVSEFLERAPTATVVAALDMAAAMCNGATIALLRTIAHCDARRAWRDDDCDDAASWLAPRLGISRWKAERLVGAACVLGELPRTTAAFEAGRLSLDQFVELARFPSPRLAEDLLEWAAGQLPSKIRKRADRARRVDEGETRDADKARFLEWWWADGSTLNFWGSLPAADGAKFVAAVDRLADKMATPPEDPGREGEPESTIEARRADALVAMASAAIAGDNDPDRATVVVHTDLDPDRNAVMGDGRPLAPEIAQMLMCNARIQAVVHGPDGIDASGTTSYVVPHWLRRQVEFRDDFACTFPGCGRRAFIQPHHIVPWPDGPSRPDNLTMVCHSHHKLVHVHGWHVTLTGDRTRWFRPDWTPYEPRPAPVSRS